MSAPDHDDGPLLALVLRSTIDRHARERRDGKKIWWKTVFDGPLWGRMGNENLPKISLRDYVQRIGTYAGITDSTFAIALCYVDRILRCRGPNGTRATFQLTDSNVHRIVLASVCLAIKFFEDCYRCNSYYGRVGGISPQEFSHLEIKMLEMTNYCLYVSREEFERCRERLSKAAVTLV
jgi:hypothetical protein